MISPIRGNRTDMGVQVPPRSGTPPSDSDSHIADALATAISDLPPGATAERRRNRGAPGQPQGGGRSVTGPSGARRRHVLSVAAHAALPGTPDQPRRAGTGGIPEQS